MADIVFPEHIKYVLSSLESAGYAAYAVGGCIRDSLLCRVPEDWDVTTSALPEETMAVFGATALPTGLKHGTVTVKTPAGGVEVTTFRSDGAYTDHRRPDSVRFVSRIEDDLSRRDFTINAMAASLSGEFIDPFHGSDDLKKGLIRCVGLPDRRFEEDALRMFRALRFSARLGFAIDPDTLSAIYVRSGLAREIAPERITLEIMKTLPFPCARALNIMLFSGLLDKFCAFGPDVDFSAVEAISPDAGLRLAGLCALLERSGRVNTNTFLSSLKCSGDDIRLCTLGVSAALSGLPSSSAGWKRLINSIGADAARRACAACLALHGRDGLPELEVVLASGECFSLDTLAVKGSDLLSLGFTGKNIGTTLDRLLQHVIEHPDENSRETLLHLI